MGKTIKVYINAQRLRELIKNRGLKQKDVAKKINVNYQGFNSRLNDGRFTPLELTAICSVLGCTIEYLCGNDEEKEIPKEPKIPKETNIASRGMTLYSMLDRAMYFQKVWIYALNYADQHMPLFSGTVQDARADVDTVWEYLMNEVSHYECDTGILVIMVMSEHPEELMEEQYAFSREWGKEKERRPWRTASEVDDDIRAGRMT